jgi:hypothetical protein
MWRRIQFQHTIPNTIGGIVSLESLYIQVHTIAYSYHWGEKDILSLPSFKRKMYIDLIEKQLKANNSANDPDDEASTEEEFVAELPYKREVEEDDWDDEDYD